MEVIRFLLLAEVWRLKELLQARQPSPKANEQEYIMMTCTAGEMGMGMDLEACCYAYYSDMHVGLCACVGVGVGVGVNAGAGCCRGGWLVS
jgi:hypothetical protein